MSAVTLADSAPRRRLPAFAEAIFRDLPPSSGELLAPPAVRPDQAHALAESILSRHGLRVLRTETSAQGYIVAVVTRDDVLPSGESAQSTRPLLPLLPESALPKPGSEARMELWARVVQPSNPSDKSTAGSLRGSSSEPAVASYI